MPNTSSPLQSFVPNTSSFIIHFFILFEARHSRGKNLRPLLVHRRKTFLISLNLIRSRHVRVFSMKTFHLFLRVFHTFGWLPGIFIFCASFPFHEVPKLFYHFIPSPNLSRVRDDFTLDNLLDFPLQISLDIFGFSWGLLAIWSVRGGIWFK